MQKDNNKIYEAKHLRSVLKYQQRVRAAYLKAIDKIFAAAGNVKLKGKRFKLTDYPMLNKVVNETLLEFHDEVKITLINGVKFEWELSGEKHLAVVSSTYRGIEISAAVNKIIVDPHAGALDAFINRKTAGLNLSDRVWKYTNQFQAEIEQGLYIGLNSGQSAAAMARAQKQYLVNPDKLFRRVRDIDGNLVLSKAAREYKPGQGIYRSSYKNAFRMTRDITNDAYREADNTRWAATPFVMGYEIKLSNNHPKHDICDYLAGTYPVTFKWTKWHIQCICYAVAVMASPEAFDEYERAVLAGTADQYQFKDKVKAMPANFNKYVLENTERFKNWKNKPNWLKIVAET